MIAILLSGMDRLTASLRDAIFFSALDGNAVYWPVDMGEDIKYSNLRQIISLTTSIQAQGDAIWTKTMPA